VDGVLRIAIMADLPGVEAIDRTSMNAFEDRAFNEAVKKTGRKRLIVGGYWYFGEVTKLKAVVGVSEVEKQAAAKARIHA